MQLLKICLLQYEVSDINLAYNPERTAHMKRLLFGLLMVLAFTLAGGVAQIYAAPAGPGKGVAGKVTAISGTTITVQLPQGTAKIATTATTSFQVNGKAGKLSDIKVGMFAHAEGTRGSDGTLTATRVLASTNPPQGPPPPHR
jgi:hypothetical protein